MATFSVKTTGVMLLMLGSFLVVIASLNVTLRALETKIDVVAYIKETADPAQIQNLRDSLSQNADVAAVRYVSKDEALTRMRQTLGEKAQLLSQVQGNPLPATSARRRSCCRKCRATRCRPAWRSSSSSPARRHR